MTAHSGEIDLGAGGNLTDQSAEVARIWVTHGGSASVWIDARVLENPCMFGAVIGETIGHAAVAYAELTQKSADDMLAAIVAGLSERVAAGFGARPPVEEGIPDQ